MKIQPTHSNILITLHEIESPDSKVLLPQGSQRYPYGLVLAVGPDVKSCVPGDKILFLASNAIGFEDPFKPVYIVPDGCVLGKYVEGEYGE